MVKKETIHSWLYCLPALLLLGLVVSLPLLRTLLLSFTSAKLSTTTTPTWIGTENYAYLLEDPDWWQSVRNTLIFTVCSVFIETLLGLGIALILHSRIRMRGLVRSAILIPWAIPTVVSARIWAWILNDVHGVLNEVLMRLNWISQPIPWLADARWSMTTLVLVDVWKSTPFMALLLLAGLQSIPPSVHEAARVDGVSPWSEFRKITLPLLTPALQVAILFRSLDALRVFDLPFVLTSGSRATSVVSIYAKQQMIDFQDLGYGSAAAMVIFAFIAVIAVVHLVTVRSELEGP